MTTPLPKIGKFKDWPEGQCWRCGLKLAGGFFSLDIAIIGWDGQVIGRKQVCSTCEHFLLRTGVAKRV